MLRPRGGGCCCSKSGESDHDVAGNWLSHNRSLAIGQHAWMEATHDEPLARAEVSLLDPQSIYGELRPRVGLELPPVRLLRWSWLQPRAAAVRACTADKEREALALPRRQDLENFHPDAFYTAEEVELLQRNVQDDTQQVLQVPVVCVSHAWEKPWHPDPLGHTLVALADAIQRAQTEPVQAEVLQSYCDCKLLPSEVAIFMDWSCVHQKDPWLFDASETPDAQPTAAARQAFEEDVSARRKFFGGEAYEKSRHTKELAAFKSALSRMQIWYASAMTTVVLIRAKREGSMALPYDARGWCTFERSCSMLTKKGVHYQMWPSVIDTSCPDGKGARAAPHTPAQMKALLVDRTFTNGADRDIVLALYEHTANATIGGAERLSFAGLGWDDAQLAVLCEWLPRCMGLKQLGLYNNELTDEGLVMLAAVISREGVLPKLWGMGLNGHQRMTAAGGAALARALEKGALPALNDLWLDEAPRSDDAWESVKAARPQLRMLG